MANNTNIFSNVNQQIVDDIIKELALQGHSLTGALEKSLQGYVVDEGGNIILTAKALDYIEKLETGLQPNQIDFSADSINEMAKYVQLRMGYTGKKALQVALLILKKQGKEGMPTKNSYQYSKTGDRTDVVLDTFLKNQNRYITMVDETVISQLDNQSSSLENGTI